MKVREIEMAKVYYTLIKKGLKSIEDVPAELKDKVRAMLDADQK